MKTLAVVIGNDEYHGSAKLEFAVKDAKAVADVFTRLGYEVIHKSNTSVDDCIEILREMKSKIKDFDATIFFFAGHGFQFNGENYLTSIECQIPPSDEYNCKRNSILLSELLDIYKQNPDKINIVIIDACRKNFGRGMDNVFAPVQAPKGTLVAFSTSPEESAKDGGYQDHSIYTGSLLQYIGRERLSVEELFKKVRRTVFNLSDGKQTPWEHTSLIGDFYFNTGQLIHAVNIPYNDSVVKDVNFKAGSDEFSGLIAELKSYDWYRQNPAIDKLLRIKPDKLDNNQQFILGRNLLQTANGDARSACNFFDNLSENIKKYSQDGINHLLNGILYEIYFNSYGEFRSGNFKINMLETIMVLRKDPLLENSFEFISKILEPFKEDQLFWLPTKSDDIIDVDVTASQIKNKDFLDRPVTFDEISQIMVGTKSILKEIRRYGIFEQDEKALQKSVAHLLAAPEELVKINSNIHLQNIIFRSRQKNKDNSGW